MDEHQSKKLFIFCGETSADHYGLRVVRHLKTLNDNLEIHGVGSFLFKELGVVLYRENDDLAVTGFLEVLKNYRKFKTLLDDLPRYIVQNKMDAVLLIDYPGFNLRLAKKIRDLNPHIKIFYYVAPQVWAWGKHRLPKMKSLIDHLFVILSFELPLFQGAGVSTDFVGHPLLDIIDENMPLHDIQQFLAYQNITPSDLTAPVISFLPGSRKNEVMRIFPVMIETMRRLKKNMPAMQFVVSASNGERKRELQMLLEKHFSDNPFLIPLYGGDLNQLLRVSHFAFVASGTATLQTAIHTVPMAVVYKLNILSYWYIKHKLSIPWIALPNVIGGKKIVAEFVQHELNADHLSRYCLDLFHDKKLYDKIRADLSEFKKTLGNRGASETVAKKIVEFIAG